MNGGITRWLTIGAGMFLLAAVFVSGVTAAPAAQSNAMVQTANNATLGTILVNSQGMTLYTLSTEANGSIQCTGACLTAWPPLLLPSGTTAPTVGSGVTGKVGTVTRSDGTIQVTYNGFPLYTFAGDSAAGQTNGQGVVAFGGTWSVVKIAAAPVATPTPTATGVSSGPMVQVANNPTLGPILVNSQGMTLYYNTAEKGTTLVCTGACLGFWPPLLLPAGTTTPTAGSGITGTLSSIARPDGGQQVTYNNEPLYTFIKDKAPGDTNGEGIQAFGGVWHAARVNLTPLAAKLAVGLTIRVTTTGSTVWGKVSVRYTVAGHRVQQSCSSASCTLGVPSGVTVHLTQSPTNSATWPFKEWKTVSTGSHTVRLLMSKTATLKLTKNTSVTAVYVLHA